VRVFGFTALVSRIQLQGAIAYLVTRFRSVSGRHVAAVGGADSRTNSDADRSATSANCRRAGRNLEYFRRQNFGFVPYSSGRHRGCILADVERLHRDRWRRCPRRGRHAAIETFIVLPWTGRGGRSASLFLLGKSAVPALRCRRGVMDPAPPLIGASTAASSTRSAARYPYLVMERDLCGARD
jgi:hypothetical protein